MAPLTIVTFLWRPKKHYRSSYTTEHVDILRRMVRRHYKKPHRFVLVTDDPTGLTERDIECFELWSDFSEMVNPSGGNNPSCYRRLRLFAPEPGAFLGERFVCVDLDTVITGNLAPLWDREEDFVIWKSPGGGNHRNPYCGSMFMLTAGARPQVWMDFDPHRSPVLTTAHGLFGSDQAWIAYRLGPEEATWSEADGVYSYRSQVQMKHRGVLPRGAKIVFFHGKPDPEDPEPQRLQWVRQNYR